MFFAKGHPLLWMSFGFKDYSSVHLLQRDWVWPSSASGVGTEPSALAVCFKVGSEAFLLAKAGVTGAGVDRSAAATTRTSFEASTCAAVTASEAAGPEFVDIFISPFLIHSQSPPQLYTNK